jgi:hypothetical protein
MRGVSRQPNFRDTTNHDDDATNPPRFPLGRRLETEDKSEEYTSEIAKGTYRK